ncbi:MAG TPA: ABC transporter substrate binding protein [Gammaproteobacteria bacterium]
MAILVSSDIPAYREVANAIATRLGARAKSWYLKGYRELDARTLAEIDQSSRSQVVAVGLDAAIAAKGLEGRQVIFSQVFNYSENHLAAANYKGVAMLPSFEKSFAIWKSISPALKQVAIITGPGLEDYVRLARAAAKAKGITLLHRVVGSDKELLVVSKSVADSVQGYWIWPDNRVLSGIVLREVLTFGARRGKEVAVFNDDLLDLGGLLSFTTNNHDIAAKVIERLERAEHKTQIPGPVIVPLDETVVHINPVMVKRFGLIVPEQYRKYLNAR